MAEASFLKNIHFDKKLENSWVARYLSNPRLIILLLVLIIGLGVYSFINLTRTLNPEINIPIVIVSTVLPGAGPKDIEQLISEPIENAVTSLDRVKTVQSTSRDSVSIVNIEFDAGVDADKARSDIQAAVDSITGIPEDAQDSKVIKLDFENQPLWTFSLTSNDPVSLLRVSRDLKQKIEDLAVVDRVEISGLETEEIQVTIKPEVFTTFAISPQQLTGVIKTALSSYPAGNLRTVGSVFSLTIDPEILEIDDIRNLKINVSGQVINFSEIAVIEQRTKPDQTHSFIATQQITPQRAVTFNIFRTKLVNINKASMEIEKEVHKELEKLPDFELFSITNAAEEIDEQFWELQRDFMLTIGLVFIVLWIFLGIRQASIAAFSAPLTFFISFIVMMITGIALSFISMFSLLLSLGLLVDDTIVVVTAATSYHRTRRFAPMQTGLLVWRDFVVAVFTTTITTVWAFIPLLLASGIIGEFIKPIPIVVSTTLMASFFVAMFIILPLLVIILRPVIPWRVNILMRLVLLVAIISSFIYFVPKNDLLLLQILGLLIFLLIANLTLGLLITNFRNIRFFKKRGDGFGQKLEYGFVHFDKISEKYKTFLLRILSSRLRIWQTVAGVFIFSVFSYLLLPLGFVKNEFFPKQDAPFLYMNVEFAPGTVVSTTRSEAINILGDLRKIEEAEFVTADVGRSVSGGFDGGGSGSNLVQFTINLKDAGDRNTESGEIAESIRNLYKDYVAGKVSVIELSGGPPAGSDLQIKLFGEDLSKLDGYANKIMEFLQSNESATNIEKSIKPGTSKLTFIPNKERMVGAGISFDTIGFWLRFYASGLPVDKLKIEEDGNENRDITLRMNPRTQYLDGFGSLNIPTPLGPIPINSLGHLVLEPNPTLITREDGKRTLSVTAGVVTGFNIPEENKKMEEFANSLNLPVGYSWQTGGVNEENERSVQSILQAMILSFILIIITMVLQFSSFRKALIVMLVIPLSISGVFIIFSMTNTPLSFPALIGVLALFGIVVKNSILIVDKIIHNESHGMELKLAIADASASRLEAIALTSICTIAGLIPITVSDPLWRGLGGAIIAGLTFSGTIMLLFIPVVYYLLYESTHDLTAGVSTLERTASDISKPTTLQSGFSRDRTNNPSLRGPADEARDEAI